MGFDKPKFRELILYIANRCQDDSYFGATKLNKQLFFSDFFAYGELGHAITGARYQKLPQGPAPIELLPVMQELEDEGAVTTDVRKVGPYDQKRPVALREADTSVFTGDELELVDDIISKLWHLSATRISDLSHTMSVGWTVAKKNEVIPYETVYLIPPANMTEQDRAAATAYAAEKGLVPA